MFTSFDENVFWKAIEEKDYLCLKSITVSTMLDDPTFSRGETMKVLEILDEKVPEIFEDEVILDYEERLDQSKWDKRYFTKLTYWFQQNFAKSRINYIKEVGKVVHKDTAQKYKTSLNMHSSMQEKPTRFSNAGEKDWQRNQKENPTKAPSAKEKKVLVMGIVMAVIALVLVMVLLIKILD